MPTICELKVELKNKGIKGISGLNKSALIALLTSGKTQPKPKEPPKPKPTEPPKAKPKLKIIPPPSPPKLLKLKEEPTPMIGKKLAVLKRLQLSLETLIKDESVLKGEKDNAEKKLKLVKAAIVEKKKKKK